jgi:hypothetical protein
MRRVLAVGVTVLALPLLLGASDPPLPVFTEVTEQAGITFKHSFGDFELDNIVEGTGSGACVFDFDNDGWMDIYFPNGRWTKGVSGSQGRSLIGQLRNSLYRNNHDGTFTDVTEKAHVEGTNFAFGCSTADIDNDGHDDLIVLTYRGPELYRNNGDGTFSDITASAGFAKDRWSLSAAWLDYNGDGKLDVFVCNYLEYDEGKFRSFYATQGYPGPLSYNGTVSALYRNNGDGSFTDVSKETGIEKLGGRCMSAVAADFNNDGKTDILQANDAMENYYYEAKGDGTFVERGLESGLAFGQHGQGVSHMGPTIGDVNRDGLLDVLIPDMDYGTLLMNEGGQFSDWIDRSGLAVICGQYTGWGGVIFDYDHDGYPDIFIATGNAHHEYVEDPVLARNNGKGVFVDVARESGRFFQKKYVSRGATAADFDNDGDLDLLVVDLSGSPHLLRNDGGNARSWLEVDARVMGGKRLAIGARVTVTTGDLRQIDEVAPARGYLSQGDPRVHFGLGSAEKADSVEVRWPDGRRTEIKNVAARKVLRIVEETK